MLELWCHLRLFVLAVTLIGAHSLGNKHIGVSSYGIRDKDGKFPPELLNAWDTTPSVLDNGFFVKLVTQVRIGQLILVRSPLLSAGSTQRCAALCTYLLCCAYA